MKTITIPTINQKWKNMYTTINNKNTPINEFTILNKKDLTKLNQCSEKPIRKIEIINSQMLIITYDDYNNEELYELYIPENTTMTNTIKTLKQQYPEKIDLNSYLQEDNNICQLKSNIWL